MRTKTTLLASALGLSLIAGVAFAETPKHASDAPVLAAENAKSHKARKRNAKRKHDPAKVKARRAKALERVGVKGARAQHVLSIMEKYDPVRRSAVAEVRKAKRDLRALKKSKSDKAAVTKAKAKVKQARQKLQTLRKSRAGEISKVLKPQEVAKLKELRRKHRSKAKAKKRGNAKAKRGKARGKAFKNGKAFEKGKAFTRGNAKKHRRSATTS